MFSGQALGVTTSFTLFSHQETNVIAFDYFLLGNVGAKVLGWIDNVRCRVEKL